MTDPWLPGEISGREAVLMEERDAALARAERAEALLSRTEEDVAADLAAERDALRAKLQRFAPLERALLDIRFRQDTCHRVHQHLWVGRVLVMATECTVSQQPPEEIRAQARALLDALAALFKSAGGDDAS